MKKNVVLALICMILASAVSAQTAEINRGYIGISVGSAIPLSSFGKDGARTGGVLDAHFAYKLRRMQDWQCCFAASIIPLTCNHWLINWDRQFPV